MRYYLGNMIVNEEMRRYLIENGYFKPEDFRPVIEPNKDCSK